MWYNATMKKKLLFDWKNKKREHLIMSITDYEFPDLKSGYSYDMNWLKINIQLKTENEDLNFTSPCLLSEELKETADYFSLILDSDKDEDFITMEQIICFQYKHQSKLLYVNITIESLEPYNNRTVSVGFPLNSNIDRKLIILLKNLSEKYFRPGL